MKILDLVQGTLEWHAHRAVHWNASDAPAMLGESPHKSRPELIREYATAVTREFSDYVQNHVINPGHGFEAKAREIAEGIIGEELYPCVGEEGCYSASFDGLTLVGDTAWEHKSLNEELRDAFADIETIDPENREQQAGMRLPKGYRIQMEQQCMVSGARRILFMASKWDGNALLEEKDCWYYPDMELRARIVAGWAQFEADVAAYQPEPAAAPAVVGRAPDQLPALHIEVTGMVTASNLEAFKSSAIEVFRGISTDLQTDQDFADAERTVKWCGEIEDKLAAAKEHALSQTQSIDALFKTIDAISEEARSKRLALDKLVKARKEERRGEIVEAGRRAILEHYSSINAALGEHALTVPPGMSHELGAAIKGKKSIISMHDAVNAVVANAKITASQQAERVRANIAILAMHADHISLFADRVQLCSMKDPDDLRNLVAARIADHEKREAERAEHIRQAEIERQREHQDTRERANDPVQASRPAGEGLRDSTGELRAAGEPGRVIAKPPTSILKLGDINALIAPLSVSADGLAMLGFTPIGTDRSARLYDAREFPAMCAAMQEKLASAQSRHEAKAAA